MVLSPRFETALILHEDRFKTRKMCLFFLFFQMCSVYYNRRRVQEGYHLCFPSCISRVRGSASLCLQVSFTPNTLGVSALLFWSGWEGVNNVIHILVEIIGLRWRRSLPPSKRSVQGYNVMNMTSDRLPVLMHAGLCITN